MTKHEEGPKTGELTEFDVMRLRDSADRTLMTWTNTAVSTIGFGFAIYEVLRGNEAHGWILPSANTPRNVGVYLVAAGTMGIIMGSVSYVRALRRLGAPRRFGFVRPALVMALLMTGLGLTLCAVIAAQIL
jgi:uncharacterized membrane protein YidH (DUF202 family)